MGLFVGFCKNYIYSYNLFFQSTALKLSMLLECKYNKLQFGVRISSIEISKQEICISTSFHVYNKTAKESIQKQLLYQGQRDPEFFHRALVYVQSSSAEELPERQ